MIPYLFADLLDLLVSPFGFQVMVRATLGRRGCDAVFVSRRPAGQPRARRLRSIKGL